MQHHDAAHIGWGWNSFPLGVGALPHVACLRQLIHWLAAAAQISEPEAYALASMAVSFRVTQYSNQTGSAYSSIPAKAVGRPKVRPRCT